MLKQTLGGLFISAQRSQQSLPSSGIMTWSDAQQALSVISRELSGAGQGKGGRRGSLSPPGSHSLSLKQRWDATAKHFADGRAQRMEILFSKCGLTSFLQLQDMGFHSNLTEIDAKLLALEKEQQGRNPGQSLDSALAKHRRAATAKEKAEATLQRAKQAVIEAQEQLQQADAALVAASAHAEAVRHAVAPQASMPTSPPPPCNKIATDVALKISAALATANANQAPLTDTQVIGLVEEELEPISPTAPKGSKRQAELTPQELKEQADKDAVSSGKDSDAEMGSQSVLEPQATALDCASLGLPSTS